MKGMKKKKIKVELEREREREFCGRAEKNQKKKKNTILTVPPANRHARPAARHASNGQSLEQSNDFLPLLPLQSP